MLLPYRHHAQAVAQTRAYNDLKIRLVGSRTKA
jgi:hypothetical protein